MKSSPLVFIFLLIAFTGCKNRNQEAKFQTLDQTNTGKDEVPKNEEVQNNEKNEKPGLTKNINVDWDKKIIKNADLSLEVKDPIEYRKEISDRTKAVGGYISKEELEASTGLETTKLTIKVPVDQFENLLNSLVPDSSIVLDRSISSEDVSGEYYDIRSRIEAKKQVRMKYLDFMKQAKNMEEVLQVQKEVNDLQEQIEGANGRISFLSQSSAMSTINIKFTGFSTTVPVKPEEPSYWQRLRDSLVAGISWLGEILLVLMSIWPILLCVLIGTVVYKKRKLKTATVLKTPTNLEREK